MRSNPIGHSIFYTRENHCMTSYEPDTILFTSEENPIGFHRHFIILVSVNTNTALREEFLKC